MQKGKRLLPAVRTLLLLVMMIVPFICCSRVEASTRYGDYTVEEKEDGTYYVGNLVSNANDLLDFEAVVVENVLVSLDFVLRSESTLTNIETGETTYVVEESVEATYSRTETSDGVYVGELVVMFGEVKFMEMEYTETTVEGVTSCEYTLDMYDEGFTILSLQAAVVDGVLVSCDVEINIITRDTEYFYDDKGELIDTQYGEYYVDDTFNIAFEKSGDVSTLVFTQSDNIGFTAVYTELENGGNLTIVGKDNEEVMLDLDVTVTDEEDGIHVALYVLANEFGSHYNEDEVYFTDSYEFDLGFVVAK